MNSQEPIDLTKAAIGVLVLCLFVGAFLTFFYYLFDNTEQRIDKMEKATTSSNMERLYSLRDEFLENEGNPSKFPLVTNVVSALTEFNEEDLLYIQIVTPDRGASNPSKNYTFTYSDVNIASMSGTVLKSDIPVTMACRELLQFSNCRCEIVIGTFDMATNNHYVDSSGPGLPYIYIALYDIQV